MIDVHSQTWKAVVAWAEARIETRHRDLETATVDVARIQGEIKALRDLIRLPAPPIMIEPDPTKF